MLRRSIDTWFRNHPVEVQPSKASPYSWKGSFLIGVRSVFPLLIASLFQFVSFAAQAQTPAQFQISSEDLLHAIEAERLQVSEFKKIAEWGQKNGVRIFVAGGTAAGLAHYIRQNRQRVFEEENGLAPSYFKSRFGWTYYDIYRSTQDADIVLDGTEAQAIELEKYLRNTFPYLQGSKTIWEVRLLREGRGTFGTPAYKEALLNNPHFRNQHSDSHSTGVIELTDPRLSGEKDASVVRDLFDWENHHDSQFLRDVRDATVSYYANPLHASTRRFVEGNNPDILSVIRFLTKSFQYGGTPVITPELEKIIETFDPKASVNSYVTSQLQKNSLKLYWHSPDLERARQTLDRLGLRQKLVALGGDAAIWLNREPLPTRPVGEGSGQTAAELKIDVVAHETQSFLAYENITMSRRGFPNVFISRQGAAGEAAVHGDGFYTRIGREGARGTKITIRFRVRPEARLGSDFSKVDSFVIFHNRAALEVIDESIDIDLLDYLRLLSSNDLNADDRGILFKFQLKLRAYDPAPEEALELTTYMQSVVERPGIWRRLFKSDDSLMAVRFAWLKFPISLKYPDLSLAALSQLKEGFMVQIASGADVNLTKDMIRHVRASVKRETAPVRPADAILNGLFLNHIAKFADDPAFVEEMLGDKPDRDIDTAFFGALSAGAFSEHFERLVTFWLNRGGSHPQLHELVSRVYRIERSPQWIEQILTQLAATQAALYTHTLPLNLQKSAARWLSKLLLNEALTPKAHWFKHFFDWGDQNEKQTRSVLKATAESPRLSAVLLEHPELLEKLIGQPVFENRKRDALPYCHVILDHFLTRPEWHPVEERLLEAMVKNDACLPRVAKEFLQSGRYTHRHDWIAHMLTGDNADRLRPKAELVVEHVLAVPAWTLGPESAEWMRKVIQVTEKNFDLSAAQIAQVLANERWTKNPELIDEWIGVQVNDLGHGNSRPYCREILVHVLPQPHWKPFEERFLDQMVRHQACLSEISETYLKLGKYTHRKDWIPSYLVKSPLSMGSVVWQVSRARSLVEGVFLTKAWGEDVAWLDGVIESAEWSPEMVETLVRDVLTQPRWVLSAKPIERLIKTSYKHTNNVDRPVCKLVLKHLLSLPEWKPYEEHLLDVMLKQEACLEEIGRDYLAKGLYANRLDWFNPYFQEGMRDQSDDWAATRAAYFAEYVLGQPHQPVSYSLMKQVMLFSHYSQVRRALVKVFADPRWAKFPEFLRRALITRETRGAAADDYLNGEFLPVLLLPHWAPHVDLMLKRLETVSPRHAERVSYARTWIAGCNRHLNKLD